MDAKSKANFINSVAGGQGIPCSRCGTVNEHGSKYCISCGMQIAVKESAIKESVGGKAVPESMEQDIPPMTEKVKYVKPASVFAEGLPAWDIVPPQIMVRRRRSK